MNPRQPVPLNQSFVGTQTPPQPHPHTPPNMGFTPQYSIPAKPPPNTGQYLQPPQNQQYYQMNPYPQTQNYNCQAPPSQQIHQNQFQQPWFHQPNTPQGWGPSTDTVQGKPQFGFGPLRVPKLDFPKFDGKDPRGWVNKC